MLDAITTLWRVVLVRHSVSRVVQDSLCTYLCEVTENLSMN